MKHKTPAPQPTMEDVLRRMLATPPNPHVKPKAKAKRRKAQAQPNK
jgi:hypothetical protein